jgi:F-type H+-transporting ATPase subunit b
VLLRLSILATEATGAAVEEEVTNPIIPEVKEILWAFVFLALLYIAMRFVLVPPIQRMVRERDEKIRADFASVDEVNAEIAATRARYDEALATARAEADEIIGAARAEADAHKARLQAEAQAEIAALRTQVQAEIDAARSRALVDVRGDVVEMAVVAASAVIEAPIDRSTATAVVDRVLGLDGRAI